MAEAAAKLPASIQRELLTILQREGRLTLGDVSDAKRVQRDQATAELPESLFDLPALTWQDQARAALRQAMAVLPQGAPAVVRDHIEATLLILDRYERGEL